MQSIENRIQKMVANNALSADHDEMWKDLNEFESLKEFLAKLDRNTQQAEMQAVYSAICAVAKNSSNAEVAQFVVDLVREAPLEEKKRLLMFIKELPRFPDATVLIELAAHKVLGHSVLGALEATSDPRAEAVVREMLLADKHAFAAAEALGKLATTASTPALVQTITSTKNNFVKRACLAALRKADGAQHVNLFAKIYAEASSEEIRWHCLVALRDYGQGEGSDAVANRLTKLAKKPGRAEPYTGGSLIAPKDIVAIIHRREEHYATEFTLGVEYLHRVGGSEAQALFSTLEKQRDKLLDSEREFLNSKGL